MENMGFLSPSAISLGFERETCMAYCMYSNSNSCRGPRNRTNN